MTDVIEPVASGDDDEQHRRLGNRHPDVGVTLEPKVATPRVELRAVAGANAAVGGSGAPARTVPLCKICRSPKRATVDAALAHGASVRAVGDAHGFSKSAIARHGGTCLPAKVARANADRVERVSASTLLDSMVALQVKTQDQLDSAISSKHKPADVAKLIKEVRENVGMLGRLLGAFAGENAQTIDNRVQVLALRDMTVDELRELTTALRSSGK